MRWILGSALPAGAAHRPGRRSAMLFLGLLVLTDVAFIALHAVHAFTPALDQPIYSIDTDRSYAELFQYIKLGWSALAVGVAFIQARQLVYVAWAALFSYLLVDDMFSLHEGLGAYLTGTYAFMPAWGLRALDFGELLVSGTAGVALLVLIGAGYVRADRHGRALSIRLLVLLAVLAFFGVVIDVLHVQLLGDPLWWPIVSMVEDGGEMITVSLMLAACFVHASTSEPPE
jgi:hypothetical protein